MPYVIRGVVTEEGIPVARTVRAHLRTTGELVQEEISSTSGDFGIIMPDASPVYLVALDDDPGVNYNAIIWDRVIPAFEAGVGGAIWNAFDKTTNVVVSLDGQTASANNSTYEAIRSTYNTLNTTNGGKYYWQIAIDALDNASDLFLGLMRSSDPISSGTFFAGGGRQYVTIRSNGQVFSSSGWTYGGGAASYVAGDVLSFALDVDNRKLFIAKNGTWLNSGDPVAGTGACFTGMPIGESYAPFMSTDNTAGLVECTLITDSVALSSSAPSGYTAGLPE